MTPAQLRCRLQRLSLNLAQMARVIGKSQATVHRYARDGVNGSTAMLIGLWSDGKLTRRDVEYARKKYNHH